jgi:SGNH hydrolase-like domain, acetyltransferase AlgX
MAIKQRTYSIHHIFILVAISCPLFFTYLKYISKESEEDLSYNKPALTGLIMSDEKPAFTKENWFSGTFQTETEDYNNDHWSLKETMVRWNNQLYYKLFNQLRVNGFVSGKENYVFSEGYIYSAFGDDLMEETKVKTLLEKAKIIQDTLKKKGIDLLLVYAPGKGEYCNEYVDSKYVHPVKTTNHALFVKNSKDLGLNHLDLYTYFNLLKPITKHPLFPKFGHHWSYYGACLASDTIIKHIEKLTSRDLPTITWNKIEVVDTSRSRDADVLKSMNLAVNPEQNMKLAYPELLFETDSLKNTTRVLTISDSYWYDQVYMGIPFNCFAGGQFWYYYNKVIPSPRQGEKVEVWQLDLKAEIESNRVIMLLYSDGNLSAFGNKFINDAYELYTSPKTYAERKERESQIQTFAKQIRETPILLKKATLSSTENKITLDSAIRINAMRLAGFVK